MVLDGVYRRTEGEADFQEARGSSRNELAGLLDKIVARLMKMLTRLGYLLEEEGITYIADTDADNPLASLQAASCTYRLALGPRAGQKVLSVRTVAGRDEKHTTALCADANRPAHETPARMGWARLLKRVFDIDLEHCPQCGGDLKIIAAIEEPAVIVKILTHLGLPARAPLRIPARPLDLFRAA